MSGTTAIVHVISSPLAASLLSTHPNDVSQVPSLWSSWWAWAQEDAPTPAWLQLLDYFMRPEACQIPLQLRSLIDAVRSLQLDRTPSGEYVAYSYDNRGRPFLQACCTAHDAGHGSYRISPKKAHEVDRMFSYVHQMVHSEHTRSVWHAVDVGSGQGYLSRALQRLDMHVLALDNDEKQTSGADRWTTRRKLKSKHRTGAKCLSGPSTEQELPQPCLASHPDGAHKGSLTHQTVHVRPQTLEESIIGWVIGHSGTQGRDDSIGDRHASSRPPVPVTLVALHACGSLTVDMMRTFLSHRARSLAMAEDVWVPHSLVVVGCCYNLMSHSDFPLSKPLRDLNPVPRLTTAAAHLAAQVPSQWLRSDDAMRNAELALRKVVYRALLQPVLQPAFAQLNTIPDRATFSGRPIQSGLGETMENRRLGKLNDKAYQDWPTFLECATDKLGINLAAINASFPDWLVHETARLKMERALFVVQTLRCLLGPLIETLILLDRRDWIQQELAEMNDCGREVGVEVVNLFDQSTGSGRNVALVVKPTTKSEQSLR